MSLARAIASLLPARQKQLLHAGERASVVQLARPTWPDWNFERATSEGYKKSVLVYRSVFTYSQSAGRVGFVVEQMQGGEWAPVEASGRDQASQGGAALQRLLNRPSEFWSGDELRELVVMHSLLSGISVTRLQVASGGPRYRGATRPPVLEMEPMVPAGFSQRLDAGGRLASLAWEWNGKRKDYPLDQLLFLRLPDPENLFWGMSPLQAASRAIDTDLAAVDWNREALQNRNASDIAWVYKDWLSDPNYREARERVAEQTGPKAARSPLVMGGDWDLKLLGRTPVEMDFVEARRFYREEVLSAFSMPPVVAGYFENATLANAEVSRRLWWDDSHLPLMNRVRSRVEHTLVPHFGDPAALRVRLDTSGIEALRENMTSKAGTLLVMQRAGVPYNEAIDLLELPLSPIPGAGDVPFGIVTAAGGTAQTVTAPELVNAAGLPARIKTAPPALVADAPRRTKSEQVGIALRDDLARIAAREAAALERQMLAGLRKLRADHGARLAGLVESGARAIALPTDELAAVLREAIEAAAVRAHAAGAELAAGQLADSFGLQAQAGEAASAAWARERALASARLMSQGSETALREALETLGAMAGTMAEKGRLVGALIGLTRPQAEAARKLFAEATERGLEAAKALDMVDRLAEASVKARATSAAESEAFAATQGGVKDTWAEATKRPGVRLWKSWLTAEDRQTCVVCSSLHLQEVEANEMFVSPVTGESFEGPGDDVHQSCRCGLWCTRAVGVLAAADDA